MVDIDWFPSPLLFLRRFVKHIGFLLAVIQSCLIVASRKHYTVDVVVAW